MSKLEDVIIDKKTVQDLSKYNLTTYKGNDRLYELTINGKQYFFKEYKDKYNCYLNELIGQGIERDANGNAVSSNIAKFLGKDNKYHYGLLTPTINRNDSELITIKTVFNEIQNGNKELALKFLPNIEHLLAKLIRNFFRNDFDYYDKNVLFHMNKKELTLAESMDLEGISDNLDDLEIDNYLFNFELNKEILDILFMFPEVELAFLFMITYNFNNLLERIEKEYKLIIPEEEKKNYIYDFEYRRKLAIETYVEKSSVR